MAMQFPVYSQDFSPGKSHWDQEDAAAQNAYQSAYNNKADEKSRMNLMDFQQKQKDDQQKIAATKLLPVANAFRNVTSPEQAWKIASENPEWMADPIQGEFVDRFLKTQTEIAQAQAGSLAGKMQIADTTSFLKRLETLDSADRAVIQNMSPGKNGGISPEQWTQLGKAEEAINIKRQDRARYAETEALLRGDEPTTTVNEKGEVSTTFKPSKIVGDEKLKTQVVNGTTFTWMPGSKAIRAVNKSGDEFKMTADQMRNLASDLDSKDPRKKELLNILADAALEQIKPKTATNGVPKDPLGLWQ